MAFNNEGDKKDAELVTLWDIEFFEARSMMWRSIS